MIEKIVLCIGNCLLVAFVMAQQNLPSMVHTWSELAETQTGSRITRPILEGQTTHLEYFEIHATTIEAHSIPHPAHSHLDEELMIVKEGTLEVTAGDQVKTYGPKSIALIQPNVSHGFRNVGETPATYYVLRYRSKAGVDQVRAEQDGGSILVNFEELEYNTHDHGGRRNYFDRPTGMCEDFEMHMTNLNEGADSHAPHTHVVEEIILITEGEVQMHIDGEWFDAHPGDIVFLDSMVPHAARNVGKGQCQYFAFQWK
jgi:(S)-ureidoglycine aminohydrolase